MSADKLPKYSEELYKAWVKWDKLVQQHGETEYNVICSYTNRIKKKTGDTHVCARCPYTEGSSGGCNLYSASFVVNQAQVNRNEYNRIVSKHVSNSLDII